jgi:hypothetical protein
MRFMHVPPVEGGCLDRDSVVSNIFRGIGNRVPGTLNVTPNTRNGVASGEGQTKESRDSKRVQDHQETVLAFCILHLSVLLMSVLSTLLDMATIMFNSLFHFR